MYTKYFRNVWIAVLVLCGAAAAQLSSNVQAEGSGQWVGELCSDRAAIPEATAVDVIPSTTATSGSITEGTRLQRQLMAPSRKRIIHPFTTMGLQQWAQTRQKLEAMQTHMTNFLSRDFKMAK